MYNVIKDSRPYFIIITYYFINVKELARNKMKICAVICEYNPFHNGHLYQLKEAKRLSGADAILCIMSGNFVQRGEAAIVDKFTRAKHAVLGGADIVIELPTVFATSNAELFAKGAISILKNIPSVTTLCFGSESADKEAFLETAKLLNNEPLEVSQKIKELSAQGISFAKARAIAWQEVASSNLLTSPNNILGVEYTRAILESNANIDILPIKRVGGGYNDCDLQGEFSSASAIRTAITQHNSFDSAIPEFVKDDLPLNLTDKLEILEKHAILSRPADEIAMVCDCTEGLENAFKKAASQEESFVDSLTSARYTSSRIRRIALQNLLKIEECFIRQTLQSALYIRILAVKKASTEVLSSISNASLPIIVRAHDEDSLTGIAKQCYDIDCYAENIHKLLYSHINNRTIFI